ncbi:MAG: sigma-70 family RNA polymerase sigma factor [Lachnospiraceae bacterium]|nr:sigma-70 family RNA polymerase sigma factor [Lachnospiraceae bacterium]MCD7766999.1 sigma-70 family RNA polymerase sigma factor [Lachnospiraceae bacterium]
MKNERFEGYFQKYHDVVMYVVWEKTSDRFLAEEIEQQVFCDFYVHMEEIRPGAEKAWLMRCTKNKVVDHLRGKQHWGELLMDTSQAETNNLLLDESLILSEERLIMQQFTGRILRQVKTVNVHWYEALELCFVEELSYSEAAERLGISVPLLRSWICRARAYVRKKFWEEYKRGEV